MMSSKAVPFLAVLSVLFSLSFAGYTLQRITLRNYSKFDTEHVIESPWRKATRYFDVKYHVAHFGDDKVLSFKLQLRGPDGEEWKYQPLITDGHFAIRHQIRRADDGPIVRYKHNFTETNTTTEWIKTLPRKEILDPNRGLHHASYDRIQIDDFFFYHVENLLTTFLGNVGNTGEVTIGVSRLRCRSDRECSSGYVCAVDPSTHEKYCYERRSLGLSCEVNEQCGWNAWCKSERCVCRPGYKVRHERGGGLYCVKA